MTFKVLSGAVRATQSTPVCREVPNLIVIMQVQNRHVLIDSNESQSKIVLLAQLFYRKCDIDQIIYFCYALQSLYIFYNSEKFLPFSMAGSDHAILDLGDDNLQFTTNDYNKVCLQWQCTFCSFICLSSCLCLIAKIVFSS